MPERESTSQHFRRESTGAPRSPKRTWDENNGRNPTAAFARSERDHTSHSYIATIPQNGTEAIFYKQAIEVLQRSIGGSNYSTAAPENKEHEPLFLEPINDFMKKPPHHVDNQKPRY
jgi:hypothetical protein